MIGVLLGVALIVCLVVFGIYVCRTRPDLVSQTKTTIMKPVNALKR